MNGDEKKYESGTVSISSIEYRDLIFELASAKKDYENANSERWNVQRERDKTQKELDELKTRFQKVSNFIGSSEEYTKQYRLFLLEAEEASS